MVWNQFPRLIGGSRQGLWTALRELEKVQREIALGQLGARRRRDDYPPTLLATREDGAVLNALLPGVEPDSIDLSVSGNTLTLAGERLATEPKSEPQWQRKERRTGKFSRTFALPFEVEADGVKARFANGLLQVELPRSKAQMPRKIAVIAN